MSDNQTNEFSSYSMYNVFYYQFAWYGESIDFEDTPEVREDVKAFSKKASKHFCVYNTIPWLTCELLGHHLDNLQDFLRGLADNPKREFLYSTKTCRSPAKKPPPVGPPIYVDRWLHKFPKYYKPGKKTSSSGLPSYVARWVNDIPIDIKDKIRHELALFPNLHFLTKPFNAFLEEIEETIRLAGLTRDVISYQGVTVDAYLEQIARYRRDRERHEAEYGEAPAFNEDEIDIILMYEDDELSVGSYLDK